MKRGHSVWIVLVCLLLCISVPAFAADGLPDEIDELKVAHVFSSIISGVEPIRVLFHTFTYEEDPHVVEYVEKTKSDEKIKQAVEREAVNPTAWWEWLNSLPVDSDITLDQQEVLEWFEKYITYSEETKNSLGRNFMSIGG